MLDVYKVSQVRKSLEYEKALVESIYKLLKTDDPDIIQDVAFEDPVVSGEHAEVSTYVVNFKNDEVGKIRAEVFEDDSFKFEEIS